ncbi:MAG: flotillin domain-containing protein, partial [Ferrovibrionaceae bacterium]
IAREREVKLQEIARDQELRQRDLQAILETELNRRDNAIRLAQKKTEEAAAEAAAEQARSSVVLAMEAVQTEKEKVQAERAREIAAIRSAEEEAVEASKLRIEIETIRDKARAEAEAAAAKAAAGRDAMLAESEGRAALIAAENALADPIIRMRLEERRLKALPELVAHLVKPAEKIQSIRINQISGLGAAGSVGGSADGGGGGGGDKPLVNQAVDGILGMALQLPAVQKLGQEIGLDIGSGLSGLSKAIEPRQTT